MTLTIGSLFAGVGGIELGLEWAGLGPVRWQVEIADGLRACLEAHYPHAERYKDVRAVGAGKLQYVDVICGGFPCQNLSSAGKRAGLSGSQSGLWYEFARIVEECGPRWVVVENVRSGAAKWVDAVRGDLERIGYASLPVPLAAADLGAPHTRARVFVVARRTPDADRSELWQQCGWRSRAHREGLLVASRDVADAHAQGELQQEGRFGEGGRWPLDSDRVWTLEPDVARVVHGLPGRMDRERALGNSVVPQCAEVIGRLILQLEREALDAA